MKRLIRPLLTLILVLGVGIALYLSVRGQLSASRIVTVRGLIGSEKEAFFQDEAVQKVLRKNGFIIEAIKAGSRQIATENTVSDYDFVFPAGVPAAEKIRRENSIQASYDVFFTPMAVASWVSIADVLKRSGWVDVRDGVRYLKMDALLKAMNAQVRWSDLPDNPSYDVDKGILIGSTDVRRSNSAAMYLALASYVTNGNAVVQNDAQLNQILPTVSQLFLRQGYQEYSSEGPFEDYLVMGIGKAPLVMVYEAQFLSAAAEGTVTPEMVLLYPEPTLYTKHVLLAVSDAGVKLGELLSQNPDLRRLAVQYGFRTDDRDVFNEFVTQHNLTVPTDLVDVIEPPSYEILEKMITHIETLYTSGSASRVQTAP